MIVSYDGTAYCGWQKQPGKTSVQGVLEAAVCDLCGKETELIGASRTDSGVHAYGNVAVFDTAMPMEARRFTPALNARLPQDIRIQYSDEVPADWHPRKRDCVKTYLYRILNRRVPMPTERLYSHFHHHPLDEEKMQQAAGFLVGTHDFTSFCSVKSQARSPVRTIHGLEVFRDAEMIHILVRGDGFLYNMIRIIAGTLVDVGEGLYPPEKIPDILARRNRIAAGRTMPACGLTLMGIKY